MIEEENRVETEAPQEDMKVSEEAFSELKKINDSMNNIALAIGNIEIQKAELQAQFISIRQRKDDLVRQVFSSKGIPERDYNKYRIALDTAEINEVPENERQQIIV